LIQDPGKVNMPPLLESKSHRPLVSKGWIQPKNGHAPESLLIWGQPCAHKGNPERPMISQAPFAKIRREITKSQQLLTLKTDWDGEGSPGYSEDVWKRTTEFLLRHARHMLQHYDLNMPVPSILPGPDGSIDVHWKSAQAELLLNFPTDPELPAKFYGDDYKSVKIKGQIKANGTNEGLLVWLKSHQ
jgi:hypothetical protein